MVIEKYVIYDTFKILGVTNDATTKEIRDGYLRKSLAHHPDRHPQSTAEERKRHEAEFKLVNNRMHL
jgi:DnaJ family protein C protein 7